METSFQPTAFVPKRPIIPTSQGINRPKPHMGLFKLASIIIFVLAVAATGGLIAYKYSLAKSNETKKQQVAAAIKNFDPALTQQLTLIKSRLDVAKQLLQNHVAFSAFLSLLQDNIVQTVRLTDLKFSATQDQKDTISFNAESPTYSAIAFQSDVLSNNANFSSVMFSNLALNDKGTIAFSVNANINPKAVSYTEAFNALSGGVESSNPPPVTTTQATSTNP